nr:DinB family protein [Bacillus thuringiensis]
MYQTIEGFLQSWTYEAESTQKMLDSLTDASLSQEIAPGHWTLGRVAWHIVTAIPVILSGTGLKFEGELKDYPVPTSAKTIADEYRKVNAAFVETLQSKWTDKDLATINDFFGRPMPNSIFLMTLINHQKSPPRTNDGFNATSWLNSSWRIWPRKRRMGCGWNGSS